MWFGQNYRYCYYRYKRFGRCGLDRTIGSVFRDIRDWGGVAWTEPQILLLQIQEIGQKHG